MKSRSPLHGYNTNYRREGKVYHVQTEDLGPGGAAVVTQVFIGGTALAVKRTPYVETLDDDIEDRIRALMRKQHKALLVACRDDKLQEVMEGKAADEEEELADEDFDIVDDATSFRDTVRMERPPDFAKQLIAQAKKKEAEAARKAEVAKPPALPPDAAEPKITKRPAPSQPPPQKISPKKTLPLFTAAGTSSPPPVPAGTPRPPAASVELAEAESEAAEESKARPARAPRIFSEVSHAKPGAGEDQLGERSLDEVILSYLAADLQED